MNTCFPRYLPLCSIPARMSRDGYAGENASIYVPFCGRLFFSGVSYTFPGSTIPQNKKRFLGGISKPDTFAKEGHWVNGKI